MVSWVFCFQFRLLFLQNQLLPNGTEQKIYKKKNMLFARLFDYSYPCTFPQAVVFYVVHIMLLIIIAVVTEFMLGLRTVGLSGDTVGISIALLFSVLTSFLIIFKKRRLGNIRAVFLIVLSGICAYIGGGLLGYIPVAYASTIK